MAYTEKTIAYTNTDATLTTFYTNSKLKSQVVLFQVTNTSSFTQIVTAKYRVGATSTEYSLVNGLILPAKSTVSLLTGRLVLETGDALKIQTDLIGGIDVVCSVIERDE